MMGTVRYTYATLAYGYVRVPASVSMYGAYVRFLVALACWACRNRERPRRVYDEYTRIDAGRGI